MPAPGIGRLGGGKIREGGEFLLISGLSMTCEAIASSEMGFGGKMKKCETF